MKKYSLAILGVALSACLSACGAESSDEVNPDYKFTYYGKPNPEVVYDAKDYVKLGKYKGAVVYTSLKQEITDDDVDSYILSNIASEPIEVTLNRKTIKSDDYLRVTRFGKSDSELFYVGDSGEENIDLLIKSRVGDTVTIVNKNNKDTTYTFTINSVVEKHTIESIDELTKEYISENTSYNNLSDLRDFVHRYLEANIRNDLSVECMQAVIDDSEVTIPDGLVDYYTLDTMSKLDYSAYTKGLSNLDILVSSYYGMTTQGYEDSLRVSNEDYIKQLLICEVINSKEDIEFDDLEYKEYLEFVSLMEGYDNLDSMLSAYGSDDTLKEQYMSVYAPLNFVVENAEIVWGS